MPSHKLSLRGTVLLKPAGSGVDFRKTPQMEGGGGGGHPMARSSSAKVKRSPSHKSFKYDWPVKKGKRR